MKLESEKLQLDCPFPVADHRFDQKDEMFKRSDCDERIIPIGNRMYRTAKFEEKEGFRQIDHALRFGAWNIEVNAGFGNSRSNFGLYSWEGTGARFKHWLDISSKVTKTPQDMSLVIKKVARFYGASLVGICRVHPSWVYSHEFNKMTKEHYPIEIPKGCDTAIVIAIAMDYEAVRTSPSAVEAGATGLGYSQMAVVASMLAVFIRHLGHRAVPSGNDTALSVPLAMAAGLGEAGRQGLLITKKFGPRVRLCKIFTDLPLAHDSYQPFGVTAFCKVCKKCAIHCPSQAIPYRDMTTEGHNISNHSGVLKWYSDYEKCFQFWSRNRTDCANCIRVCAFNKPLGVLHDLVRWQIKNISWMNKLIVKMDDFLGYGKPLSVGKFWSERNYLKKMRGDPD